MEKWEYCSVMIRESGGWNNYYVARVAYYSPDGNIRVEEFKTDLKLGGGPYQFLDATGYALACLGQQGWELAAQKFGMATPNEVLLKRPVTTT